MGRGEKPFGPMRPLMQRIVAVARPVEGGILCSQFCAGSFCASLLCCYKLSYAVIDGIQHQALTNSIRRDVKLASRGVFVFLAASHDSCKQQHGIAIDTGTCSS